jgi:hypothetical protein
MHFLTSSPRNPALWLSQSTFSCLASPCSGYFRVIYSQYQHVNQSYAVFNSQLLNDSYASVMAAIPADSHNNSPYLVATLRSSDAPAEDPGDSNPVPTAPGHNSSSNSQSLAMIILYVIVSVVSALFIIVIVSGVSLRPASIRPPLIAPSF